MYTPMTDIPSSDNTIKPTKETYEQLQAAFEHLNKNLFKGTLSNPLITLQRRKRSYGYFAADRFGRADGVLTDEIALNPSHIRNRQIGEVLATLAHEMVHLWQHRHGKPGRGRYHNREWAEQMKAIGLQPTDTGEEGGKETGESVHHYVVPDGPFERASQKLISRGFALTWTEKPQVKPESEPDGAEGTGGQEESKSGKRIKYTCPKCELNAWAKHDAQLICGADMAPMKPS